MLYSKIVKEKFRIFKNGMHMKELYQVYICTKFQVDILKNDQLMAFERSKMPIFRAVSWDLHIFTIFKVRPIWAVQKLF